MRRLEHPLLDFIFLDLSGKSRLEYQTIHDIKEAKFTSSRIMECLVPFEATDTTLMLGIVCIGIILGTLT